MAVVSAEKLCVVGLGYVGLPVAVELGLSGQDVIGFDIDTRRIEELSAGFDRTKELDELVLKLSNVRYSHHPEDLRDRTFFIVTVPTPVDKNRQPDLRPIIGATETVGKHLSKGACVVYESTVYPGVTEDICRGLLAKHSGLAPGTDFTVGYSPERINPGDREHSLRKIIKVVSGEDSSTLERVSDVYSSIVDAGIHKAPSIRVAEAAKVIENTQRDLNIALMNELAMIFDLMGIATRDVLRAAGTKWNFLRFTPGLVGGHCIGVDPYYLTAKAEELGYHPEVILAGRRINDGMGGFIAQKMVKLLMANGCDLRKARIAVLGVTFKENVPDIRNSRVIDVIDELNSFAVTPIVVDPLASKDDVLHEYGLSLSTLEEAVDLDGVILASPHRELVDLFPSFASTKLRPSAVIVDVKGALSGNEWPTDITYWAL
jgi:UDP-N-acetyl-D-glucosamine/UDP-N-acetyl-D-galactosamine dehydrogenase